MLSWENYFYKDEACKDDISYGYETEIQDEAHDNVGIITGVESEDNKEDADLTYSVDDDNLSTVSKESEHPYI